MGCAPVSVQWLSVGRWVRWTSQVGQTAAARVTSVVKLSTNCRQFDVRPSVRPIGRSIRHVRRVAPRFLPPPSVAADDRNDFYLRRTRGVQIVELFFESSFELISEILEKQLDFLADRTIGRAFGTVSRLSVCLSSVCRL